MNTTGKIIIHDDSSTLEPIIFLDQTYFPNPWPRDQWLKTDFNKNVLLEWNLKESTLGFALFGLLPGDDTAHLYKIFIVPEYQGQGEAHHFWLHVLSLLRQKAMKFIYLEVESTNEQALSFYKKVGFVCLRRVKSYYSNGNDGLMLQLTL